MSFNVRKVQDPAIYVRRNKPDILGIGNVWDNIGNFKDALDRLEDHIDAADKPVHQKLAAKKTSSLTGPILKEISSETQHLGKVTRFQLLGENCSYKSLPQRSAPSVEIKTRRNDGNKAIPFSDISSINRETYSKSSQDVSDINGYFPSRYTVNGSKSERSSFFMTTTVNPVVINDMSSDSNQKESSFVNTTINSSSNSQQFSLSTPPSFHGKAALAKNGGGGSAALERIKERVYKQKAMLLKKDEEISSNTTGDRRLHNYKDNIAMSSERVEKKDTLQVPLKRKVGAISSSGPTYRGFNPVSSQRSKKNGKPKAQQGTNKTISKGLAKPLTKPEPRVKKAPAKLTRIVSSKCPKEVISTTSWRDGRATVKKILGAKKVKPSSAPIGGPGKADTTYNVTSPTQDDDISEGKLSSDENEDFEEIIPQAKDAPKLDEVGMAPDTISPNSDAENDEKSRDVLSTEAQSMLAELAEDNSESESEMKEEKLQKQGGASKKTASQTRGRKSKTILKPAVDEKFPKEKSRHYDQTEVQKYMAQQLAERKKKLKQEKMQKKKHEEERQRRLNDLYERQKKRFAMPKKEKCFRQTFSCDGGAVHIPGHESYPMEYTSGQNESDKENTDVDDVQRSSNGTSLDDYSDGDEDNDIASHEELHMQEEGHLIGDKPPVLSAMTINQPLRQGTVPLDKRAQRLSALQSTALALQSRLQSQALRLGGVDEESVSQPVARVLREEEETEFQEILPGVTNIRKQADKNEKQLVRVEAATKIQAAYRAHNVRKISQWRDENAKSDENSLVSSQPEHSDDDDDDLVIVDDISERHGIAPAVGHYEVDHSDNGFKLNDLRFERSHFLHADVPAIPSTHFSIPSVPFEPRGDRFSVMNVFSRRHPNVTVEEILNEQTGSETASLLDVEVNTDTKENYEDNFTDEDISTTSALTEGDLRKESPVESRAETYSECFESEAEEQDFEEKDSTMLEVQDKKYAHQSQSPTFTNVVSRKADNGTDIIPVMTSTMYPEPHQRSFSLSDDSELVRRPVFLRPAAPCTAGNRMSPDSLQRKLTAEVNWLENVEDSVRQVDNIDKTRAVSLAQQETVSLAQILKAKQQNHEQEIQSLRLKAKDEAIQAAKDLEKTRQAAATAASHAVETLAEVQNEALKTNVENSKRYVEEASRMASSVLSDTTKQLSEFCKNVTTTTSNAVEQLHKIDRPTTTLVERATSISEGHATPSENESGEHTRTSDVYSNHSKSRDTSPSVTSGRQKGGYSSDDFESYKSRTDAKEESEMRTEQTGSVSLSIESIPEDLADKSATEDDTTINDESPNDSRSLSTEKRKRSEKGSGGSPFLDNSSQFEDSSHAPTDDEIDSLFPSKEHRRRSLKLIMDDSFDEEKGIKEKNPRTPFESDDSFGRFTVEMIQQYMKKEEARTKHQSAILRLREKSLKEKTNADLQWLKQLRRQSQNKGSDDVMPSIKKRERGILMKLEAEKEEIKCLKAANRAASFQRRFMIYQQREITRLHQATLNIRERIQRDVSKKSSPKSTHEPSPAQPKTSSPMRKTNSSIQTSPSNSLSEVQKSSPSANSVSEDIREQQGTSHASPTSPASPFPSYSTPKIERPNKAVEPDQPRMSSFVGSGEPESTDENGDCLLKIQKMLLKKQQKLVEDESEVNIMLRKVTEMINNQKNNVPTVVASHENTPTESARIPSTPSDVKDGEEPKSHSELSIPEDLASTGKTISEEIEGISEKTPSEEIDEDTRKKTPSQEMKDISEKTPSEYTNCTFESDDTTTPKTSTLNTEAPHVEDDHSSLTVSETSDHSDYEEKIKKLKEKIQREKMKAVALEKKKRKMKRSAMKKEVLTLENELKNTKEDNQRKMVEIRTASTLPPHVVTPPISLSPPSIKFNRSSQNDTPLLSKQNSDHSVSVKEALPVWQQKKMFESCDHEVEESLIEILDDGAPTSFRDMITSGPSSLERSEGSDITEEISEHLESEAHSIGSIPEETDIVEEEQNIASKASAKSYTEPESSPSIPEDSPSTGQNLRDSLDKTPEIAEEVLDDDSRTEPRRSPKQSPGITEDVKESHGKTDSVSDEEYSYTEPRSSPSISDGSPTSHEKLNQSEDLPETIPEGESDENLDETSVQEDVENRNSDISEDLPEVAEDEDHISEKDDVSAEKSPQDLPNLKDSENLAEKGVQDLDERSQISEISDISENIPEVAEDEDEDHISEKDNVSAEKALKDLTNLNDSENLSGKSAEDFDVQSQVSDNSHISENSPEACEDDISDKSNLSAEKTPQVFPNFKDSELSAKLVPKDLEEIQHVTVTSSHDIDTSEKSTPDETSIQIAGKEDISEKPPMLVDQEHLERNDAKEEDDKSRSRTSSIAEEIPSAYDDEDFSEFGSLKEESEKLIFEDTGGVEKADGGEKQSHGWDSSDEFSDEFAHTSAGSEEVITAGSGAGVHRLHLGDQSEDKDEKEVSESSEKLDSVDKNESARSESSKSEKMKAVERVEPASQEEEQEYSEDFEADDDETESDIPEILEEEGEEVNDEYFKTFTADDKVVEIEDERIASDEDELLDDITDEIYREIMDDSFDCVKTVKKSRQKVEQKLPNEAEEVAKEKEKNSDKSSTVNTEGITKDLLADAFLQMMTIKRGKNTVAKPPGKSPGYETSPLGLGAGLGATDEQKAVSNALMIAKSNQALQKEALKAMDQDIEGLLGTSLDDDEDDGDFPVNESKFPDNVSDDTEPSVHDYSPMFAVPHNAQEVTSIINSTIDILAAKKRDGLPLDDCKPTAQILGADTENEFENRSTRSYINLVFDLTKEVYMDTVLQNEVTSQPPWAKAKWKGGQKLSRNFMRWKSDDEVRALVLERVTHTIGLGTPRTTMQTLQRKTPVRGNKKDNVDAILIEELRQEEPQWTDYDEDETAVKFQVADSILDMLLDDTVRVFNAIQAKKNVPDDVLVI